MGVFIGLSPVTSLPQTFPQFANRAATYRQ